MFKLTYVLLFLGIFLLGLITLNEFTAPAITPSLQRAESIGAISSILIMAIAISFNDIKPERSGKVELLGEEGFEIDSALTITQSDELAWGSQLILTATAASTILIYWNGRTILRRGLISPAIFIPGDICQKAIDQKRLISLVNTSLFPGRFEFDPVLKDLPSVIVYPLSDKGWTIVGGWSIRCFTKSDEIWIEGWSKKIISLLDNNHL